MSEEVMLSEAIKAIRQGQDARARDLLTRLLRTDQENPQYWLWMSAAVASQKERIYCLKTVLRLEPDNIHARRGLIILGVIPPDESLNLPSPPTHKWKLTLESETSPKTKINWKTQSLSIGGLLLLGAISLGLMIFGLTQPSRQAALVVQKPTKTPGPPPTYTATPTYIGYVAPPLSTITPTPQGPRSLLDLLDATYTPTPLYVNTPHVVSEAYRSGHMALNKGDLEQSRGFFEQAAQVEPNAPDVHYYIGEVYRLQDNPRMAIQSYARAINANPYFAPAYLGRARARLALDPQADVQADLDQAIANDPYYGEAYLARAAYHLDKDTLEKVNTDLLSAEQLSPNSPLLFLYRARLALKTGEALVAYQSAEKAYELDRTSLAVYRVLADAALLNGDVERAIPALETYLSYKENDASAWLALGRAYAGLGNDDQVYTGLVKAAGGADYEAALRAFEQASQITRNLPDLDIYRGIVHLELQEGQAAVNIFLEVKKQAGLKAAETTQPDPIWFGVNLAFGRALLLAERHAEAAAQLGSTRKLATTNEQTAAAYYWHSLAAEGVGDSATAIKDLKAMLTLPKSAIPEEWVEQAHARLAILSAPTPTRTTTPTPSQTPTRTLRPTPSPTFTRTTAPSATP